MGRKLGLAAAAVCVVATGVVLVLGRGGSSEEFCTASAVLVTSEPIRVGQWTLLVDEPSARRDPCQGDDLWHYLDEDLDAVDGVLFDDCVLSWVDGGRTSAVDAGIECTPGS